jgi:hypothetical protein
MIRLDRHREPGELLASINHLFDLSAAKIRSLEAAWRPHDGAPVFTVEGQYRSRGWTEWTQGFQFGSALLQFDATGEREFLDLGRSRTIERMAPHLTHFGVHDHGFNNVSTYGTLWRMACERRIDASDWERRFYELALKASGAVQARRWTRLPQEDESPHRDRGFIYSFNGAHSLFVDAIRSLRTLAVSHRLGHYLAEEQDARVSLLDRLVQHARATAAFSVYYGRGRDGFDVRGRVAHESLFNAMNGTYRGPSTQQGFSPFSTWTRGLAWALLGFAEQLEFLQSCGDDELDPLGGRASIVACFMDAACATADFYIEQAAAADGIPYWDTGAPGLTALQGWQERTADPFNDHEPVDSSAAAIASQGLLRLGRVLVSRGEGDGRRYIQAGLRVVETLLNEPYVSKELTHQGLLLHSVYHWPNRWDHVPCGSRIPRGESSQWGDYHLREVALYVQRLATDGPYLTFFGGTQG